MRPFIASAAITATTTLLRIHHVRRNAGILHRLSDAQLRDIGLSRSDIASVANGASGLFAD